MRQGRPVQALRGQHVGVVQLDQLVDRERLQRAEHHVPGVVDDDIDATLIGDDLRDGVVDRILLRDVQLDGTDLAVAVSDVIPGLGGGLGVATLDVAHPGVDDVSGVRELAHAHGAESAGCSGDDDGLRH